MAKINLALSGLPEFPPQKAGNATPLNGRIQVGNEIDYLERAFDESKYGNFSRALSGGNNSDADRSLTGTCGKHVMSIYMQYAPYKLKGGDWDGQRAALGETVVKTLSQYAAGLAQLIESHQVITPKILKRPTASPADTFSTANSRSTSSSPCVHCWIGAI